MRLPFSTASAAIAVALTIGLAAQSQAQDTTRARSSQRIPVRKEARGGEVATPASAPAPAPVTRVDTVTVTNTVTRVDTVTVTNTVTRVDTLFRVPEVLQRKGFFIGVAGGAAIPSGDFRDGYKTGGAVDVPFGWQSTSMPLGIVFDVGYARFQGRSFFNTPAGGGQVTNEDPSSFWGNADLKLNFHLANAPTHPTLYVVGGGGVQHFNDFRGYNTSHQLQAYTARRPFTPSANLENSTTVGSVNGGGGVSWAIGRANWFIESRWVSAFTANKNTPMVPLMVGVTFF